jgi:hypothetical protein
MGFFHARQIAARADAENDELRLDTEPIIFEITPAGWSAMKLTRAGWFRSSARTIEGARAALTARIRTALAES